MAEPIKLFKSDVKRALALYHFRTSPTQMEAFERLRSVQFDPIAPVGCNHDLVLQARVPGYRVGDWTATAYQDRQIYDGWDKQASLVPMDGWPIRRLIHTIHRRSFEKKIFEDHKDAVEAVLTQIEKQGPLMPRDCDFQLRKPEWEDSWLGPSVTKQILRALWHSGLVMTSNRKSGQHVYDLTERVVPAHLLTQPRLSDREARREIAMERHRAMGLVRPTAPSEIWSYQVLSYDKKVAISDLLDKEEIVPVEVDGVKANASPDFLTYLDRPAQTPRVVFVAPLDPILWDRKMTAHLFGFDYTWEIYTPLAKRRWGYYVLPIFFGQDFVARAEFTSRKGSLEMLQYHAEDRPAEANYEAELERALLRFMDYCDASRIVAAPHIDPNIRELVSRVSAERKNK